MIEDIVRDTPNDTDLGAIIRKMYDEPKLLDLTCSVCGKEFKGTVIFEICPNCYI